MTLARGVSCSPVSELGEAMGRPELEGDGEVTRRVDATESASEVVEEEVKTTFCAALM